MNVPEVSTLENFPETENQTKVKTSKDEALNKIKANLFKQERDRFLKVAQKIRESKLDDSLFANITAAIQTELKTSRAFIYRFEDPKNGTILTESLTAGWTPYQGESLPCLAFGAYSATDYQQQQLVAIADLKKARLTPHQAQLWEKFQVQASLGLPIILNQTEVWGLLIVQQCDRPRQWQQEEVNLLSQWTTELTVALQPQELQLEIKGQLERERTISKVVANIQKATDLHSIFRTATKEARRLLNGDRVVVYRFNPDWSGEVLAESLTPGWVSVMDIQKVDQSLYSVEMSADERCTLRDLKSGIAPSTDTYLKNTKGGGYVKGDLFHVVSDIYAAGFSPCYLESLEKYQAKAYIIVPIFQQKKLWGLFAVYQNSGARQWQESDVNLMLQLATPLGIAIQQKEYINKLQSKSEQEKTVNVIVDKIRKSLKLDDIFSNVTQEVRKLLNCDRSVVYQFNEDWSGQVIAESVASGWVSLLIEQKNDQVLSGDRTGSDRCLLRKWSAGDIVEPDAFLRQTQGGRYVRGQKFTAVNDIYTQGFPDCYVSSLEKYQAKAYLIAPIFKEEKLWGLLGIYQNDDMRVWQDSESDLMVQIANQLAVAIQQAEYVEQLQIKAQQEQAINRIGEKIRQSLDIKNIFQSTTQEIRQALQSDRSVVYQFNEDWTGQVVAESVASGWVSLLVEQENDQVLSGDRTGSDRCLLRNWSAGDIVEPDSFLRQTQGGRYVRGQKFTAVNDIYSKGFPDCYVSSLEKYQAKAYLIAPIFIEEKLWGLLGIYQNDDMRVWQDSEIELTVQIANQLAVALQQTKLIEQIQSRNQELAQNNERENAIIQFSGQLVNRLAGLAQQNTDSVPILEFATRELRQVIQASRVGVYRFFDDWMGEFIVESVDKNWPKLVGTELAQVQDTYLKETQGGRYPRRESLRVDDIYQSHTNECHIALLEQWGTKSYMIAPIFKGEKLWGLLGVYQNDYIRHWSSSEEALMNQVATQVGVTLQLAEYLAQTRSQEQKLSEIAEKERAKREQFQQGALRVLRALEPSFRGDLTVRAPLSEDEIGTIADGYNTTIQSLRELVRQVQVSASRVGETSDSNSISVQQLSNQSQEQVNQLQQALKELEVMVELGNAVTDNAQKVEQAVQEANNKVQTGDSLMEKTVDSILEIRDTVSETAKKIKRLGEASQKISKVVNLIDNFATQTNLLSLNAAIEATRAGEYGKGFAVVADEVRVLAYQSANATTEIERIIEEIQKEVNEVTEVMEIGIAQVVQGSNLVDETRNSLSEIVTVTGDISDLVQGINQATTSQSQQSQTLTQVMTEVSTLANKTVENSNLISQSFQELLETSQELQTSVSQFKVD